MSVLVVSRILRPFVNTLTPDEKYCLDNTETLKKPVPIQLSNEVMIFSEFFTVGLKLLFNFEFFRKKLNLINYIFPKLYTTKNWLI